MEVLQHFGFDCDTWIKSGYRRSVLYTAKHIFEGDTQEPGPLASALEEHREKFRLKPDQRPPITIVGRDAQTGQVISASSTGLTLYGDEVPGQPPEQNWFRRLIRWLFH
jgi:hypothetical protein